MKNDYETALDMMTEIIGQMRRMPEPKNDGLGSESALKEQVRKLVEDKRKLVEQLDIAADENGRLEHEINELNRLITANKPKPCPFCGVRPDVVAINKEKWVVACHCVTCAVNPETDAFDTAEEAVSAWNHRGELTCDWR